MFRFFEGESDLKTEENLPSLQSLEKQKQIAVEKVAERMEQQLELSKNLVRE